MEFADWLLYQLNALISALCLSGFTSHGPGQNHERQMNVCEQLVRS